LGAVIFGNGTILAVYCLAYRLGCDDFCPVADTLKREKVKGEKLP